MHLSTIPGEFADLNTYVAACRTHRYKGAKLKREETERAAGYFQGKEKLKGLNHFIFRWFCKDRLKDPDNIAFAKKFILDGMGLVGVIKNDGWKTVGSFEDEFEVDKENPRVEIHTLSI